MPERSSKKKRPRDIDQIAISVVDDATDEVLGDTARPPR